MSLFGPAARAALRFCTTVILLLSLTAAVWPETAILPLDQVKPGMVGKGRSVFKGSQVEEFEAEILGVLSNALPKRNIILARLKGQGLENSGVIQGMSGSPVYVDGRLVGAVAYSFPYSKEPIAGLTPIEEMLSLSGGAAAPPASFAARSVPLGKISLEDYCSLFPDVFGPRLSVEAGGRPLLPLGIPLMCGGLSSRGLDRVRPALARMGFLPMSAAQVINETPASPSLGPLTLQAGDPVSVQLVGGDMDLSALGTVTYVDGRKVYAFGHPMYNLGPVEYGMARADVLTVVSNLESSFKLAAPGALVGTFVQDRSSGAYGELGRLPSMIPVNIKLGGGPFLSREYKIQVVNDRILGAFFTSSALSMILSDAERALGDLSLSVQGDFYLDTGQSVHVEDLYSGNFDSAVNDLSSLVLAVVYFLYNNEFQSLGLHRLDLDIQAVEHPKVCLLEKVLPDRYEASPGEPINIKIFLRTYRGEVDVEEIQVPAPALPSGSTFSLVLGDAASMQQVEAAQYRSLEFVPRSLEQLIRLLNNLRKNNRIYLKVLANRPGLFLKGEEMSNLPLTVKSLFTSPRASASNAVEIGLSTQGEYQLPIPYVLKGMVRIPMKIKK
ncbi:MAG: SpoIVB peptidase S55 domain-containing protein [Candidatus Aminicenantales bacterium]